MSHKEIKYQCETLGLIVRQEPATDRRSFSATFDRPGCRVYWSTSYEGGVLGMPRVIVNGADTHARSLKEIAYLVKLVKTKL
jgi:hypothetical protein